MLSYNKDTEIITAANDAEVSKMKTMSDEMVRMPHHSLPLLTLPIGSSRSLITLTVVFYP